MEGKSLIDRIKDNKTPFLFLTGAIVLDKTITYLGLSNPDLFLREGNVLGMTDYLINNFGLINSLVIHSGLQMILIPLGFAKIDEIFEKNSWPKISRAGMYAIAGMQCIVAARNYIMMG